MIIVRWVWFVLFFLFVSSLFLVFITIGTPSHNCHVRVSAVTYAVELAHAVVEQLCDCLTAVAVNPGRLERVRAEVTHVVEEPKQKYIYIYYTYIL